MGITTSVGKWRIGYRSPQGEELPDLIHAVVWPKSAEEQGSTGQWLAELNPIDLGDQIPRVLRAIACRLGLLPVHFAPDFERALKDSSPVCLVADTNAIYQGALYQALRLRKGKPTTMIVPDQVFMELQRRRGRTPSKNPAKLTDRLVQNVRFNLPLIGTRVLDRIRNELRYVVHQARPPDAMVRYFGSEAGDRAEDESSLPPELASPSFQRDRLILEVVRHTPNMLPPGLPVWLATGDADLAAQASSEGFNVGFAWVPDGPQRFVLTSPHIEARTGTVHHVTWENFVEELTWNLGAISIQQSQSRFKMEHRLPDSRHRVLGSKGVAWPDSFTRRYSAEPWITSAGPSEASPSEPPNKSDVSRSVPRKAPAAQSLTKFLLASAVPGGVAVDDVYEPVRPYLLALGWVVAADNRYEATDRGKELAVRWRLLTRDSVEEHAAWLRDASAELLRLQPVAAFKKALAIMAKAEASSLAQTLSWSERDVHSQARLLGAFGLLVRVASDYWDVTERDRTIGATTLLTQLREMKSAGTTGVVRTDALFRALLDISPMSLIDFRLALLDLLREGKIRPGGSVPPSQKSETITVEILLPGVTGEPTVEAIDLGAGDFLLPGESSQALELREDA